MQLRNARTVSARRAMMEEYLGGEGLLESVAHDYTDESDRVHCENLIGAVTVPLGVAGPLRIISEGATRDVYLPLATTEGALVASVNRGAKAIREAGGVSVVVRDLGATRGPVFESTSLDEATHLTAWIQEHTSEIAEVASRTSSHIVYTGCHVSQMGRYLYVQFRFTTGEAMGMNMVTIATERIAAYIESQTSSRCIAVAGNYDSDKKPAYINHIMGRGMQSFAEVTVPSEVFRQVFRIDPIEFVRVVTMKCLGGSIAAGSMGHNAHHANIIAAFFMATGQDPAHVAEGSNGTTFAEIAADGAVRFSVSLPDLMIGSVGGGTKLRAQTAARNITQAKNKRELAEVLAGAVCAGELSLLASITARTLGAAHQALGR